MWLCNAAFDLPSILTGNPMQRLLIYLLSREIPLTPAGRQPLIL